MTNYVHEWIAEREQLEQAAAPGPWHWEPPSGDDWPTYDESLVTEDGNTVLQGWGYDASGIEGEPADREFIADARTSLPAARRALKAVLAERGAGAERFGPDFEAGVQKGLQLARRAIEAALRGES